MSTPPPLTTAELFAQLQFRFPFRTYQTLILNQVATSQTKPADNTLFSDLHKYHIVAPPGSGKTIVGLELIRRFGHPAVVFAPTSTIAYQWKQKTELFIPDTFALKTSDIATNDSDTLKAINCFTYQLISTPSENLDFIEEAALFNWKDQLIAEGTVSTIEEAEKRIATLKKNNRPSYTQELTKHYKKCKDEFLRDPTFDGMQLLHKNAQQLIHRLVEHGVKTIVMDESHHLLDYWALVLKELIKKIPDVRVIGLTATPPISADEEEIANYLSIMGDIDFEIPTPAVVKEGNLAPYQDLVYLCNPTSKEQQFIDTLQQRFVDLVKTIGEREQFQAWITHRIIKRPLSADGKKQEWTSFFNSHLYLSIAGVKYIQQIMNQDLPRDVVMIEEMTQKLELQDWVYLLADYSLNFLKISPDPTHHQELREIKAVLRSFGFVLTESGIREHRSPADKILAFSQAKTEATVEVLKKEMKHMGDQLRVTVLTDFEKQSATNTQELTGILDPEAGGAVGVFKAIVNDSQTTKLEPVLVTGTTVLIDKDELPVIVSAMKEWQQASGLDFTFLTKPTEYDRIIEITGQGKDWRSNTYVRMVTHLFENGVIKCMVGTRALLGEGWDSLRLNTLIDLTTATTSTTVNQIRGRTIRLDPQWPEKLSNNWDIICIAPKFERGWQDFERFEKKHRKYYGLDSRGNVVKGLLHVDSGLGVHYGSRFFQKIKAESINARMLVKASNRKQAYKKWRIGEEYSNFEYSATKLQSQDLKFQTVHTLRDSLKAIFNRIVLSIILFYFFYKIYFGDALVIAAIDYPQYLGIFAIIFLVGVTFVIYRDVLRYIKKAFIEVPVDSHLLDIGQAVLTSLRESKLIDTSQSIDNVRVVAELSGFYDVYLDYATPQDARLFSQCFHQLMSPVVNQRYIVSRSIDHVRMGFYTPIWWFLRKIFRLFRQEKTAYHPVPQILAVNKARALHFAEAWKKYVGGGELIYTRSEKGAKILLKRRRHNHHKFNKINFEVWK